VDAGFVGDNAPVTADTFKDTVRLIGIVQAKVMRAKNCVSSLFY